MRRLQTLLLSFSLITIASSSSISKRCKDPNWELTLDNYKKANVDQWLAWWWPQQTDHSKSVADLIANEFFDDTGRHCPTSPGDTSGDCTNVISCNSVNVNKANVTQAYFAYNSMVNLNTGLNFYISGLQNVSTLDILQSYDLVSKFTQSAVAPTDNMILKRLLGFVSTLLSAAGSFVGTAGSVAITATNGGIAQLTLGLKDPKTQS
ncbi:hypothetical protein GQ43DRAFT_201314 [Delitschia confertaspora ATCC 74209]|uniref:Uncharacterized protein n=1 Tax=Delitschia confertaspora ATCC 74209 TaxID=1513339 RepID=A0A9P4JVU1_9PLEO|nr:hypothetical protein GQ43DRAFT_201314 [Delitschia confertaspora ATCC 74209]